MECADKNKLLVNQVGEPAEPCVMVIFGASGDLTKRKLIPAIYNLGTHKLLPDKFAVLGVARSEMSNEEFRKKYAKELKSMLPHLSKLISNNGYVNGFILVFENHVLWAWSELIGFA